MSSSSPRDMFKSGSAAKSTSMDWRRAPRLAVIVVVVVEVVAVVVAVVVVVVATPVTLCNAVIE